MIKTPINVQELRRKIYVKAKSESQHRFWGLYVHICKFEVLKEAYLLAKRNNGAPGIDGLTFGEIEAKGENAYLEALREELLNRSYQPMIGRKVKIPKPDGKSHRVLNIPSIRDRIVQGAVKLILEPIFEADFQEGSYGYRPKRQAVDAINRVSVAILQKKTRVIDLDISKFFDTVRSDILLCEIAKRVQDSEVLHLVKLILKSCGKRGLSQGGPFSPLASNIYLNSIDKMLEKAKQVTRRNGCTNLEYARFADDMVILIDQFKRHAWLVDAVLKRLQEELGKLGLELNQAKTKIVDLTDPNQSFRFLGFDFRSCKTLQGKVGVHKTPKRPARIKLQREIKAIFNHKRGRPINEVVETINPIIRGWVNYFRVGNSGRCFRIVKTWVENKVRRHVYKAKQKRGFGWKRWSTQQLYQYTKLYNDYQVRYSN